MLFSLRLRWALLMASGWMMASAQPRCVVIDKETGTPLRDVKVYTDKGTQTVSDYQGRIYLDTVFHSATLSHVSYLSRVVKAEEMRDTLWMIPKENRLGEVVVWGTDRKNINSMVSGATRNLEAYAPPKGLVSFDFFEMFRKKPMSRKARKKNKELLENWDRIYGK